MRCSGTGSSRSSAPERPCISSTASSHRLRGTFIQYLFIYANIKAYDPIYELTGVTQGSAKTESYTYDPIGNRLSALGVSPYNNKHDMAFPDQTEKFDFDREVVLFFGQDRKTRIRCAISREALDDDFRADNREKVEVFRENRKVVAEAARQKYLAGDTETDGSVLVHSGELAKPKGSRE